jgi:hypothetical protein
MMDRSELESAEAILPFVDLGLIGFIFLFQIRQNDPTEPMCVASLNYLVPKDQQAFLYSKVPYLKFKAEEIAAKIKQNFIYDSNTPFPTNLQNTLKNWIVTVKDTTTEVQIIERKVTLSERKDGSTDFLFSQVKKNEDRFLGAMYRGEPVFVTGDSGIMIDMVVHSLDFFIPQVELRKVSFSEDIIDPKQADLIGIKKDIMKNYPNSPIIDIDKRQVKQGKSCNYCKEVIKKVKKEPLTSSESILTNAFKQVLDVANLLIDAFSHPDVVRDQMIKDVQNNYQESLIEVAVDLAAKRNPLIKELLLAHVANRFIDWMDGL